MALTDKHTFPALQPNTAPSVGYSHGPIPVINQPTSFARETDPLELLCRCLGLLAASIRFRRPQTAFAVLLALSPSLGPPITPKSLATMRTSHGIALNRTERAHLRQE